MDNFINNEVLSKLYILKDNLTNLKMFNCVNDFFTME